MLKPSLPSVSSHACISSAMLDGVPTKARPPQPPSLWASWRTVRPSRRAIASTRSRPEWLALVWGTSGREASRSNWVTSWPSQTDREWMALSS